MEALYGDAPETIDLLRRLRDEVLRTTPEGQALIGLYYGLSPVLFRAAEEDGEYREQMKQTIDTIVLILRQARSGHPHLHYYATKHTRAPSGVRGLSRKWYP